MFRGLASDSEVESNAEYEGLIRWQSPCARILSFSEILKYSFCAAHTQHSQQFIFPGEKAVDVLFRVPDQRKNLLVIL